MHFTPQELWAATGTPVRIVLLLMMLMAVWCVYVAIERTLALAKARKKVASVFANADLIVTPPATGPAPEGLNFTGDPLFNKIWTALGWSCLTVPATKNLNSLPLGIQIVAPQSEISAFLANAAWVEMTLNQ